MNNRIKKQLMKMAKERHGTVLPCGNGTSFKQCFTSMFGYAQFWYNSADGSTRMVKIKLQPGVVTRIYQAIKQSLFNVLRGVNYGKCS